MITQVTPPKLNLYDMAGIFKTYKDENDVLFYNFYNSINISGEIDPVLYDEVYINESDNWYSLSSEYYNTTYLWWTILMVNNINNPLEFIDGPKKIKILKANVLSQILSQINS